MSEPKISPYSDKSGTETLRAQPKNQCINCARLFASGDLRGYYGLILEVGPFCEACYALIKTHEEPAVAVERQRVNRLRQAFEHFGSVVMCVLPRNTRDFMEYLGEEVAVADRVLDAIAAETGEPRPTGGTVLIRRRGLGVAEGNVPARPFR